MLRVVYMSGYGYVHTGVFTTLASMFVSIRLLPLRTALLQGFPSLTEDVCMV